MSKMTLTKSQHKAIEILLSPPIKWEKEDIVNYAASKKFMSDTCKPLDTLTVGELARALFEGYEVEPLFDEGDIVVCEDPCSGDNGKIGLILSINMVRRECTLDTPMVASFDKLRLATEDEEVFYSLGRKVGEFKKGDRYATLLDFNLIKSIEDVRLAKQRFDREEIREFYPVERILEFKGGKK